jgi:hypothetical protein
MQAGRWIDQSPARAGEKLRWTGGGARKNRRSLRYANAADISSSGAGNRVDAPAWHSAPPFATVRRPDKISTVKYHPVILYKPWRRPRPQPLRRATARLCGRDCRAGGSESAASATVHWQLWLNLVYSGVLARRFVCHSCTSPRWSRSRLLSPSPTRHGQAYP